MLKKILISVAATLGFVALGHYARKKDIPLK
jgi:hypothetical protein